ncbi:MAG: ATP-grasp domain-containing protein [Deltaproteobacteria bacterium]|nr:ATP-grasp domain-containing protein [Deltaproteobacteria bacterium]MBW2415991.1 ATP-grasp domain-containing protein [Deltaproteobacteria bacterium]
MTKPITRLLIANRGEIARRILRSAHEMGLGSVAVFADPDANEPFVREADQAVALRGTTSAETYLDAGKILEAARRTGADAIHPGYGFLAENADFARAVGEAGLIWVGPPAAAIAEMGDKLSAKRRMQAAGVPTLPAVELKPGADAKRAAREIGFPVLVKAAAGGGGKGMRVVESEADLADAVESARREAGSSFGDDTVFLERWLSSSRHVEIQILGDSHGNLVHCFERECSIQRRHQKIIEEAPSPAVSPELREQMGEAAASAGRAIGYTSAGTVEFLLQGEDFWFLEVNTRLQVEHPVTEAITGLDLVREQLRVAQGEKLGFAQADLSIDGHAIEARLYAEDPERDFLPATGHILAWQPSTTTGARFDSGVETGSEVGIAFDPMLAKVIVHAPTRREAALRLARVLETTRVQGLVTNRDFLVATLRTPEFLAGDTTTDFIERVGPARRRLPARAELAEAAVLVALAAQCDRRAAARVLPTLPTGWRNTPMPREQVGFRSGDEELTVHYRSRRDGGFDAEIDGIDHDVRVGERTADGLSLEIDGRRIFATLTRDGDRWLVHGPAGDLELLQLPRFPAPGGEGDTGGLRAPMPGKVLSTHVSAGDSVEAGQLLLVLEAMKMEHRITAPRDAEVVELRVAEGDQVANGELLVVLSGDEPEGEG